MDNLPKDPPVDPNNPYFSQSQPPQTPLPNTPASPRGEPNIPEHPDQNLNSPTTPTPPNPSHLSPPITITENTKYSEKKDPPLFNISVIFTNPVTYSTLWKLKPKLSNIKLSDLVDKKVVVTGNLTSEAHLIEVSEVIVSETNPQPIAPVPIPNLPNIRKF